MARQGWTCTGCHEHAGSNVTRLLAKPYPETFYAKFDPDNFALCFTCHDKKTGRGKQAEGSPASATATKNLQRCT